MVISDVLDIIRLLFRNEKKPFLQLKSILGFYPHDIRLYQQALVHKSVAYHEFDKGGRKRHTTIQGQPLQQRTSSSRPSRRINNERLEFLGDAVLGTVVADILYHHYDNKQEGFLTTLRSKLVCRNTLNKLAVDIGLDKLVQHAGAVTTGHNSFMNGNAFEAFIGAIYLDRGYRYCYRFLEKKVFNCHIDIDSVAKQEKNFKSTLIEWCQKHQYHFEFYQKEMHDANKHNIPMFHSFVCIEGVSCGTGMGYSKKESDQNAACQALQRIKRDRKVQISIQCAAAGQVAKEATT